MDPNRLAQVRDALKALAREVDAIDWSALDMCDCGHRQIEHEVPKFTRDGTDRCLASGCPCLGFDDSRQRIAAFNRHERERAEAARARLEARQARESQQAPPTRQNAA